MNPYGATIVKPSAVILGGFAVAAFWSPSYTGYISTRSSSML